MEYVKVCWRYATWQAKTFLISLAFMILCLSINFGMYLIVEKEDSVSEFHSFISNITGYSVFIFIFTMLGAFGNTILRGELLTKRGLQEEITLLRHRRSQEKLRRG